MSSLMRASSGGHQLRLPRVHDREPATYPSDPCRVPTSYISLSVRQERRRANRHRSLIPSFMAAVYYIVFSRII